MSTNEYHFITHWRVEGDINEVADVLKDAAELPRWWPSVYLDVKILEPGDKDGIGKVVNLYTKGWLPYTLQWDFRVTESSYPHGFSLEAWGDFNGRGIWGFAYQSAMSNRSLLPMRPIRRSAPERDTLTFEGTIWLPKCSAKMLGASTCWPESATKK